MLHEVKQIKHLTEETKKRVVIIEKESKEEHRETWLDWKSQRHPDSSWEQLKSWFVLLKHDNFPPLCWTVCLMQEFSDFHLLGSGGFVRPLGLSVLSTKTSSGQIRSVGFRAAMKGHHFLVTDPPIKVMRPRSAARCDPAASGEVLLNWPLSVRYLSWHSCQSCCVESGLKRTSPWPPQRPWSRSGTA